MIDNDGVSERLDRSLKACGAADSAVAVWTAHVP